MSKLRFIAMAAVLALLATMFTGAAAPGAADDPVVSKSYLDTVFVPGLMNYARAALQQARQPAIAAVIEKAQNMNKPLSAESVADLVKDSVSGRLNRYAPKGTVLTLQSGQTLTGSGGTVVSVVSGTANLVGTVVDFSLGKDLVTGDVMPAKHMLGLLTGGRVRALSAVRLEVFGYYRLQPAPRALYTDLAGALNTVGLLAGTGNGYELERAGTRVEVLVMMIKLFGENDAALAYKGKHPFTDVPAWAEAYVAYAYNKKYTAGTSATTFSPGSLASANQYATFLLKALGYDSDKDFTWTGAVSYAAQTGLYTKAEAELFSGDFSRDTMAYMSWYALFGKIKTSREVLLDKLVSQGAISSGQAAKAKASVTRARP